jgi:hypothetical protein
MNRKVFVLSQVLILALVWGVVTASANSKAMAPDPDGDAQATPQAQKGQATGSLSAVGSHFTYQGRLTASGSPANGQFDLQFTLWDAVASGNQVGSAVMVISHTVTDGLFTVGLDFGAGVFQGSARWLEIGVRPGGSGGGFTNLSPRQALSAAPYAVSLVPGATITGTSGNALLSVYNANANGVYGVSNSGALNAGVSGYSTAINGNGLIGEANTGASAVGVWGRSYQGYGGYFTSTVGTGVLASGGNGIYSTGVATDGVGLWGVANTGPEARGVYGTSTSGYGVYGRSTATDGRGVYGESNAGSTAAGVYGSSATGYGVHGFSANQYGVYGHSTNGDGVYGMTDDPANSGVAGANNGSGRGTYGFSAGGQGVYGESPDGVGGYFRSTNGIGLRATSDASNGTAVYTVVSSTFPSVWGWNNGTGVGVDGVSESGYGVYGYSGNGTGVYGYSASENGIGVRGTVSGTSPAISAFNAGIGRGVAGFSSGGTGVYGNSSASDGIGVQGVVSGTNAAVQGINYGSGRSLYGWTTDGVGVAGYSFNGYAMDADGHAQQTRDKGGWAKALVRVAGSSITRCYNSQGTAPDVAAPCGFALIVNGTGDFTIDFNFTVSDRFFSIVPEYGATQAVIPTVHSFPAADQVRIRTYSGGTTLINSAFYLIVY